MYASRSAHRNRAHCFLDQFVVTQGAERVVQLPGHETNLLENLVLRRATEASEPSVVAADCRTQTLPRFALGNGVKQILKIL